MEVDLKYVISERDRYGNLRFYYRRKPAPRIRIRATPGTPEFLDAYRLAEQGKSADPAKADLAARSPAIEKGTLRHLVQIYRGSPEFKSLDARTQRVRSGILDRLCAAGGDAGKKPYGARSAIGMEPRHIRMIRDENADRPEAANGIVKALRQVFAYAIEVEQPGIRSNPARDVPYLQSSGDGHHAWTLAEVEQFEATHPIGSRARLALAALLYTGQRRSDIVAFGEHLISIEDVEIEIDGEPEIVQQEWLTFRQFKGRKKKPIDLSIPIIPAFREIIDATPGSGKAWLLTEFGRPFTANGFGNWFAERCAEAGVPGRAHGLRKATAARLAELQCTDREIMAITGHTTSKEIDRYTRSARQKVLAASAMGRLSADVRRRKSPALKLVSGRTAA